MSILQFYHTPGAIDLPVTTGSCKKNAAGEPALQAAGSFTAAISAIENRGTVLLRRYCFS